MLEEEDAAEVVAVAALQSAAPGGIDAGEVQNDLAMRGGQPQGHSVRLPFLHLLCECVGEASASLGAGDGIRFGSRRFGTDAGEPVWITARLTRDGCRLPPALRHELTVVRVFENPPVIEAAADRLGVYSPPLVCLYGRPSTAAWAVLAAIAASGSRMLLSTDRDGAGKQIAAEIVTEIKQGFGPGMVAPWLPGEDGTYEEERLDAMLVDISPRP